MKPSAICRGLHMLIEVKIEGTDFTFNNSSGIISEGKRKRQAMTATERDILQAIRKDANRGFGMLLNTYQEQIYWHIRRITVSHADAQDALQETFVRVYASIDRVDDEQSLTAWIYRIASNEALRQRERNSKASISLDEVPGEAQATSDQYIDYSDLEAIKLQQAIQSLPYKQQLTFNLRYYDELDYDTIASITESTPSAAKSNYHQAKEKIINYMNSIL